MHNFSENMANIDALFPNSLTFLRFILNLPPPLGSRIFRNIHPCLSSSSSLDLIKESVRSSDIISFVFIPSWKLKLNYMFLLKHGLTEKPDTALSDTSVQLEIWGDDLCFGTLVLPKKSRINLLKIII